MLILKRLKELRTKQGLTFKDLSDELAKKEHVNIAPDTLAKYERGDRKPKIDKLKALAKFFKVSVRYIKGETFKKEDIIRMLSFEYANYCIDEYKNVYGDYGDIGEYTVGLILEIGEVVNTIDDYLIYHHQMLPLQKFSNEELRNCTSDVKVYWTRNFNFVFNNSRIKLIMKYGDTPVIEILRTLKRIIYDQYLKDSETAISKNFDRLVESDLSKFVGGKDELMRFSTKKEIRDTVNNLISQLKCFEDSIEDLPSNPSKPIRIDTTKNINTTKK